MSVKLEALEFSHILRSCVLCHCLEKGMKHSIIVLTRMASLKANMLYSGKGKQHRKHRVAPTVEAG